MESGSGRHTRRSPIGDAAPGLLVDIQTAQGGFFGNRGIRRYAIGFARALRARSVVRALLLSPARPWHEEFPAELLGADEVAWATLPTLRALESDAAAYIVTSPFEKAVPVESAVPPFVFKSGIPIVAILYDLIPEIVDVYPPSLMRSYWARRPLLQQVDLLLTLSEHVRRDAIARLGVAPERVAVIGAAASDHFRPRRPDGQPRVVLAEHLPRITRPFVLSVTGWLPNKNAEGLIEAWARMAPSIRADRQLVLTCPLPPGADAAWNDMASGLGLAPDDVVVNGSVDDEIVRALYQEAELVVVPSFEEGFGLPALEAARCGCPAITSNASSLPEVLEWEPATFPPGDLDAMAAAIERGLLDSGFRADLRAVGDAAARRHTWDRVAERAIRACASMPAPRRQRRVAPRRIAVIARLSSPRQHHARAIDRAIVSLSSSCDVGLFDVAQRSTRPAATTGRAYQGDGRSYPAAMLGKVFDPWGFDTLVYVVDRHPPRELIDLARAHPGVAWFVETPDDHVVAAELARRAVAVIRSPELPTLPVDAGPFGRAVPVTSVSSLAG